MYTAVDLGQYCEELYRARSFEQAFSVFEKQVIKLGYDGVLYTFIPRLLIDSNFNQEPVYKVSESYSPQYLQHYEQAHFERDDPLIQAVNGGVAEAFDWWGDIPKQYMSDNPKAKEVIATSLNYGINNGITIPLLNDERGVAGASFITEEDTKFSLLKSSTMEKLELCTRLFHNLVFSGACYTSAFVQPILQSLTNTEKRFLAKLAQGKTPVQIAQELGRSEKYLEQVMLKVRRKFSHSSAEGAITVNRNQIMYYSGLMNLVEHID
ncbi:autoinducer binding domain-containing protein [Sessilibacter corallicola]|uniref:Transcription factor LuxR-like autoinducer-binding domain-containing protein n=1 Tax=Sessilibacter corallicola TaxID=2904075 RepID=A0ABQ0A9F1_9GAMM|nr:autoinducer binding domain-containing protein [Sessilibacter corallicola]